MRRLLAWRPDRGRLAFRQAVAVGVGAAVLAALSVAFELSTAYRDEQRKLRGDIAHILELVRGPATEAAFHLDPLLAQSVVAGLQQLPAIAEARLIDDLRQPLAETVPKKRAEGAGAPAAWLFGNRFQSHIQLKRQEDGRDLGQLVVLVDPAAVAGDFIERAVQSAVLEFLRLMLIGGLLFLVLFYFTTRPLLAVSQLLARIDPRAPAAQRLPALPLHRDDEIGALVGSINGLLQSAERSIKSAERSAAALSASEARLSAIMNHANTAISIKDLLGRYVFINRRFEEIFGLTAGEVQGASDRALFPSEVAEEMRRHDAAVISAGRAIETEEQLHRDGPPRWYLISRFPLVGPGGRIYAVCAMATDTTERRQLESQLQQAQKMEAVGQLTGGVAHDFNNLLTVILSNADFLESELADRPELQQLAQLAREAAERGSQLTKRLLAFSRRQPLDAKVTDVVRLIRGMGDLMRRTLGEQITIELALAQDAWPALVDRTQLEAALLNLAVNARDAMPDGGRLTIEAGNVRVEQAGALPVADVEPGEYVAIAVSDTGIGMTSDVLARAFEPFFTTKDVGKGTGLGLSMVYGFVRQSGGQVRLYSEPGHGTTVRIYLPRGMPAEKPQAGEVVGAAVTRGRGETVLVVEDNELVRSHVERMLTDLGYRVIAAPDGRRALEIVEHTPEIDLVFTDMVMPGGIDGLRLAEEAKRLRPGLPVLLTSGFTEASLSGREKGAGREPGGEVEMLAKPYRRDALAKRLRELLD
jgi:PAS domain S-box-containing protein